MSSLHVREQLLASTECEALECHRLRAVASHKHSLKIALSLSQLSCMPLTISLHYARGCWLWRCDFFFFFLQWSLGLPGMWEYFDTWIFNTSCSSQSVEKCFNNLEFNLWIFYCLGRLLASMCKLIMRRKCATLCLFSKCYQWMLFFFCLFYSCL